MRGRRRAYGISALLASLLFVCMILDIRLRPPEDSPYYTEYHTPPVNESELGVSQSVQTLRFYNLLNTSIRQYKDRHLLVTHRPLFTTDSSENKDNSTRANGDGITTAYGLNIRSRVHFILIVSYMRSGSTLTGDIMQHFPGAFYIFEPFHSIVLRTLRNQSITYLNGTKRIYSQSDFTDEFYRTELQKWMECRFEELDVSSLVDNFHNYFSRSMRKYAQCWQPKPRTMRSLRECLPVAKSVCENAQYRLFKFIRLPTRVVDSVFELYPRLQVVHLLRDPRGVMMSQIRVKKFDESDLPQKSEEHCSRINSDLFYTVRLNKQYPNRVKILLYENLAENPLSTATRLYQYIDMYPYEYVINYVKQITHRENKDGKVNDDFGVVKVNSTQTAYSWRDVIGFDNTKVIDSNCQGVYNFLGYKTFDTAEDVLNHSLITLQTPNSSLIV